MDNSIRERFLKYIAVWTTSDESSEASPSAAREKDLGRLLVDDLHAIGVDDAHMDDYGNIYASIPATPGMEDYKKVGFISHMDTAPDFSGRDVKPQIIPDYDGGDVVLTGSGDVLSVSDFPELAGLKGRTLITTDGTTLLGADDKAGVTEIMAMAERLLQSSQPHGTVKIAFTCDEEVGRGTEHFDVQGFGADYAYTVDGDYEGEVAWENFNAASVSVRITGKNVHPGEGKDIMKNAAAIAAEFASLLPSAETPAHTEKREGFYHLTEITGDVASASMHYIIRDHDRQTFENRKHLMQMAADFLNAQYGEGTVALTISDTYYNMAEIMQKHPAVIRAAEDAIRRAGLDPISRPVRGGTDGASLSFMGLPCPNLGTGGYGFHGPYEHITLEAMETETEILLDLATHPLD